MAAAKSGDTVKVHYTGKLDDGTQFDSSSGRAPLEFTIGSGQVISGFENAAEGMSVGETRSVRVPPEEAYGEPDPQRVQQVTRDQIPEHIDLTPGNQLQAQTPDGAQVLLTVVETDDQSVTLDANHPLAGKALNFDIELVEIK